MTANKRAENIKDVPTSISVLGGEELSQHHVVDYDSLTRSVPGISFGAGASGSGAGEGLANIEIRGVSSNSGSSTVAIYLDDTPLTVKNTYDGATQPIFLDFDRVEVLRGPQGTIYGASSMGGTIKFISKQPNLENFSLDLTSDLGGTRHGSVNYDEDAVINIPIVPDVFAIRSALSYGDDSGWIDNYDYATGTQLLKSGVNDTRHIMSKTIAKWQVDADFTITPEIFFQRVSGSDSPVFYPELGLYKQNKEVVESQRDTLFLPSLTVDKGLSFATLTSVTSYFWRQEARINDGTYYNSNIFGNYFLAPADASYNPNPAVAAADASIIGNLASPVHFDTIYGQATEEIRLTSLPPEVSGVPIKWVAGLFYDDQWDTHRDNEPIPGLNAAFQAIHGFSIAQTLSPVGIGNVTAADLAGLAAALGTNVNPNLYNADNIYFSSSRYDERQYAAFGQADFDILPTLHGTAGLRYVYARTSYTRVGSGFYDLGNISPYVQVSRYYAVTPKFSVTYDVSPSSSVYATAAKGFRLGGPTGPTPVGPNNACSQDYANLGITNPPVKYDSDKLWSYEVGTKASMLDHTLSVNAGIYYINWENIQQTIDLPICGFNFTSNVGNAESYGTEIETHYKPPFVPGLTVGASIGTTHADITSTTNAATAAVGQRLLNTPEWTAAVTADYDWSLSDTLNAFVRADFDMIGHSHGSYQTDLPDYNNPAYNVLNVSAGLDTDKYEASLYIKNALYDQTIIQRPLVNSVVTGYTVQPMTIGIRVTAHF